MRFSTAMAKTAKNTAPQVSSAILLVDDHPVVRESLALRIQQEDDLTVCAEADGFRSALDAVDIHHPHLAILDMNLPDGHGLELIKEIKARWPEVRTLVFSMNDEMLYAERALRAGAEGYVMKSESPDKVIEAVREVLAGRLAVSANLSQKLLSGAMGQRRRNLSPVETLSDRELEVFRFVGQGACTKEIAQTLHLSIKTIETHRERIKQKLQIGSASELIAAAARWRTENPSN